MSRTWSATESLSASSVLAWALTERGPGGDAAPSEADATILAEFLRLRARERSDDRGADDLFALLVERYKDRVFRLAVSILGPAFAAEAEEVTQDVFIQVYRKASHFRFESKFSTWLYRIAYRKAVDLKRRARFHRPHLAEEHLPELAEGGAGRDPADQAEDRERRRQVLTVVQALEEPYRTALYLRYWCESSVAEIAEVLDAKQGTVKSYLFRARERVARQLEEAGHV